MTEGRQKRLSSDEQKEEERDFLPLGKWIIGKIWENGPQLYGFF